MFGFQCYVLFLCQVPGCVCFCSSCPLLACSRAPAPVCFCVSSSNLPVLGPPSLTVCCARCVHGVYVKTVWRRFYLGSRDAACTHRIKAHGTRVEVQRCVRSNDSSLCHRALHHQHLSFFDHPSASLQVLRAPLSQRRSPRKPSSSSFCSPCVSCEHLASKCEDDVRVPSQAT